MKRATYHAARPSLDHILTMILSNPEPLVSVVTLCSVIILVTLYFVGHVILFSNHV